MPRTVQSVAHDGPSSPPISLRRGLRPRNASRNPNRSANVVPLLAHAGERLLVQHCAYGAALPILFILAADNVPDHDVEWRLTALGATACFVALGVLRGFGFPNR